MPNIVAWSFACLPRHPLLQVNQVVQTFGPNGWNTWETSLGHSVTRNEDNLWPVTSGKVTHPYTHSLDQPAHVTTVVACFTLRQVQQVVQTFGQNGWNTCKTSFIFRSQQHQFKIQRYRLGASWQPTYISTSTTYPNRISLPRLRACQYSIPALSLPTDYRKSTLSWQLSCHFQAIDPRSTTTNQYTHDHFASHHGTSTILLSCYR